MQRADARTAPRVLPLKVGAFEGAQLRRRIESPSGRKKKRTLHDRERAHCVPARSLSRPFSNSNVRRHSNVSCLSMSPEPLVRTLSAMHGDGDTRVVDLFDAWSDELPPTAATINGAIRDILVAQHGRTRVSALFKMPRPQVEAIMARCGAGEGWAATLEDMSGFKFASTPAPSSAHLSELSRGGAPAVVERKYNPTLSDAIVAANAWDDERIPEKCFAVVGCACPEVDTLEEADVEAFTSSVLAHLAAKHNCWNIGKALARKYGAQARARFPNLPDYGKTRGCDRDLGQMIHDKCKNRTYVRSRTSNPNQPPTLISPARPACPDNRISRSQKTYKKKLLVSAVDVIDVEAFNESNLADVIDLDHEQKLVPVGEPGTPAGSPPSTPAGLPRRTPHTPAVPPTANPAPALQPVTARSDEAVVDFGEVEAEPASQPTVPVAPGGGPRAGAAPKAPGSARTTGDGKKKRRARPPAEVTFTPHHSPSPTHGPSPSPRPNPTQLSEYEQKRLDNIKENTAKLANLGLGEEPQPKRPKKKNVSNPVVTFTLTPTLGVLSPNPNLKS